METKLPGVALAQEQQISPMLLGRLAATMLVEDGAYVFNFGLGLKSTTKGRRYSPLVEPHPEGRGWLYDRRVGEWVAAFAHTHPRVAKMLAEHDGPRVAVPDLEAAGVGTPEMHAAFITLRAIKVRNGLPWAHDCLRSNEIEGLERYMEYRRQKREWKRLAAEARHLAREGDEGGKCLLTCEILLTEHAAAFPAGTEIEAGHWILNDGTIIDDHAWLRLPGGSVFDPTADQVPDRLWEGGAVLIGPDAPAIRHYQVFTTEAGISEAAQEVAAEAAARRHRVSGETEALERAGNAVRLSSRDRLLTEALEALDAEIASPFDASLEAVNLGPVTATRLNGVEDWRRDFWERNRAFREQRGEGIEWMLERPFVRPAIIDDRGLIPRVLENELGVAAAILRGDSHVPAIVVREPIRSPERASGPDLVP